MHGEKESSKGVQLVVVGNLASNLAVHINLLNRADSLEAASCQSQLVRLHVNTYKSLASS